MKAVVILSKTSALAGVPWLAFNAPALIAAAAAAAEQKAEDTGRVNLSPGEAAILAHLLGTCRMGDDPEKSVMNASHRSHDVPNRFICDGSSFVTSGRGQPTMTIQALAFHAAEHIADFARGGEI